MQASPKKSKRSRPRRPTNQPDPARAEERARAAAVVVQKFTDRLNALELRDGPTLELAGLRHLIRNRKQWPLAERWIAWHEQAVPHERVLQRAARPGATGSILGRPTETEVRHASHALADGIARAEALDTGQGKLKAKYDRSREVRAVELLTRAFTRLREDAQIADSARISLPDWRAWFTARVNRLSQRVLGQRVELDDQAINHLGDPRRTPQTQAFYLVARWRGRSPSSVKQIVARWRKRREVPM